MPQLKKENMEKVFCNCCHHEMTKLGTTSDCTFGIETARVKYVCPNCGHVAFLDPEKWNL